MTNDLEQFSEEYLKEVINSPANDLTIALASIALAVKQAKPDYHIVRRLFTDAYGTHVELDVYLEQLDASKCRDDHGGVIIPVYTTPQPAHAEQDGWIKCSNRMPQDGGRYLAWVSQQNSLGLNSWADNVGYQPDVIGFRFNGHVTHWMLLPAAPKPESELLIA